ATGEAICGSLAKSPIVKPSSTLRVPSAFSAGKGGPALRAQEMSTVATATANAVRAGEEPALAICGSFVGVPAAAILTILSASRHGAARTLQFALRNISVAS